MTTPTQQEYEFSELRLAMARERETERAPLTDRQDARERFAEALTVPGLVSERLAWLLDGNYGYGQMKRSHAVVKNPNLNRTAVLCHMIACYEWSCPQRFAVDAWKRLDAARRDALEREISAVIGGFESE